MLLYHRRDQISWLAAVVALAILLSPILKYRPTAPIATVEAATTVQLLAEPEPEAPPPPPIPVPPPRAVAAVASAPASAAAVTPPQADVAPQTAPAVAAAAPAAPAVPTVPTPAVATAVRPAGLEDQYIASVRSYLNSIKRYPTGREASIQRPRGKARIWFVLGRDGHLLDCGIDESSDSLLLDRTALQTVQRGGFPAFPETAWSGHDSHRFTVELEFIPAS